MFSTAISAPLVSLYDGKCITVIQTCTRVGVGVSPRLVETVSTGRELATDDAQPARHGESVAKLLEVMRSALRQPRLGRRRQATDDRTYNLPVVIPVRGAVMNNRFANAQGGSASQYMLVIGDLKLFEPRTMCPIIAVRDREEH